MNTRKLSLTVTAFTSLLGAGASASPMLGSVSGDLAYSTQDIAGGTSLTNTSLVVSGDIAIAAPLHVVVDLGIAQSSVEAGNTSGSGSVFGNPFVGVTYGLSLPVIDAHVGIGAAIPLLSGEDATTLDEAAKDFAPQQAAASRGLVEYWLWHHDTLTLVPSFGLGVDLPGLDVKGEIALPIARPTEDDGRDTEVGLELTGDASLGLGMLTPGLRVSAVMELTAEDGEDASQLAAEPYIGLALGELAFVQLGFQYHIDEPLGPSFDDERLWALRLRGGVSF